MSFVLGRQTINSGVCADIATLARQIQEVVEAIGNPGPIVEPTDLATNPCGEILGSAYVRANNGAPVVSYVDAQGQCQDVAVGGGGGGGPDATTIVRATVLANLTQAAVNEAVTGVEPNATIDLHNPWGHVYVEGDQILAVKIQTGPNAGKYVNQPDVVGGGGGGNPPPVDNLLGDDTYQSAGNYPNNLVYFELTENLSKAATQAAARNVINPTQLIFVLDPHQEFFGKAAYQDLKQASPGSFAGFYGYGVKVANNHQDGKPGYRILTMEGWHRLLVVELAEDATIGMSPIQADLVEQYLGSPGGGRVPILQDDDYDIQVHDPHGVVGAAKEETKFFVGLRDDDDGAGGPRYEFLSRMEPGYVRIRGQAVSAVTRSTMPQTFLIDNVDAVIGANPTDDPADQITVTVNEPYAINCPENATIYAFWDESLGGVETNNWNAGDGANLAYLLRGRPGFSTSQFRVLVSSGDALSDLKWLSLPDVMKQLTGWAAASNQSILHDANQDPIWRNDGVCS